MTGLHRDARARLDRRQQDEWRAETKARADRLPKGLAGLWHRLTGKYQSIRAGNEAEAADSRKRQPDKYAWLGRALPSSSAQTGPMPEADDSDATIQSILHDLRADNDT